MRYEPQGDRADVRTGWSIDRPVPAAGGDGVERSFLVERRLPRISGDDLAMLHSTLTDAARRFADRGDAVSYLGSTFLPHSGRLLSRFIATTEALVRSVNEAALVPFGEIEEVLELTVR